VIDKRPRIGPRGGWLISFGIIGGIALVLVLTTYPLPVTISGEVSAPGTCANCPDLNSAQTESLPKGALVNVTWSETSGKVVAIDLRNSTQEIVCNWYAAQGSCTFVSYGGNYTLSIFGPRPPTESSYGASFTMEWYAPLL
jgi:hypothetical protein